MDSAGPAWRMEAGMDADPSANAGYLTAAYVVTAVILVGYALSLWRRSRRLRVARSEKGVVGEPSSLLDTSYSLLRKRRAALIPPNPNELLSRYSGSAASPSPRT